MNSKQQQIYDEIITTNIEPKYIFISGAAGVGKSVLLKNVARFYKNTCSLVAFSAIAARNIGGQTIHSKFKLNFENVQVGFPPSFENMQVLIIDEISTVSNNLFEIMDTLMKDYFQTNKPFGNKTVLCFGDFYQLPPIDGEFVFKSKLWENFVYKELTENMRQSEKEFIENLNFLRIGENNKKTLTYFNKFYKPIFLEQIKTSLTLVSTKKEAKILNINIFESIKIKKKIKTFTIEKIKKNFSKDDYLFCYPISQLDNIFHDKIDLCEGTRIMFTVNSQYYLNGDIAIVKSFNQNSIVVEFVNNREQANIFPKEINFKTSYMNGFSVKGFPIDYAWACTIHKTQGITVDKLIVDPRNTFENGQLYVALSRVKHSTGILLKNLIKSYHIMIHPDVKEEYERLIRD